MTVNIPKLRGCMVEKGYNVTTLSRRIGMNKASFYRKLQAEGFSFTIGEMYRIIDALQLDREETACIFLSENSRKCEK